MAWVRGRVPGLIYEAEYISDSKQLDTSRNYHLDQSDSNHYYNTEDNITSTANPRTGHVEINLVYPL